MISQDYHESILCSLLCKAFSAHIQLIVVYLDTSTCYPIKYYFYQNETSRYPHGCAEKYYSLLVVEFQRIIH